MRPESAAGKTYKERFCVPQPRPPIRHSTDGLQIILPPSRCAPRTRWLLSAAETATPRSQNAKRRSVHDVPQDATRTVARRACVKSTSEDANWLHRSNGTPTRRRAGLVPVQPENLK